MTPQKVYTAVWKPANGMMKIVQYNSSSKSYDWKFINLSTGRTITVLNNPQPDKKKLKKGDIWALTAGRWVCDFDGELAFACNSVNTESQKNSGLGYSYTNGFFVNQSGDVIIRDVANYGKTVDNHFVVMNSNKQLALYGNQGQSVFGFGAYQDAHPLVSEGSLGVKDANGKWGIIDLKGQMLVTPEYSNISPLKSMKYGFQENGKWGVRSLDGTMLAPSIFEDVVYDGEGNRDLWVKNNGSFYHFDVAGQQVDGKDGYASILMYYKGMRGAVTSSDESRSSAAKSESFAHIVNNAGSLVYPFSVPYSYLTLFMDYVSSNGGVIDSQTGRAWLLNKSVGSRKYGIDDTVPDDDWDY